MDGIRGWGDIAGTAATRRIPGYARKKDFLRRQRNSATLCGKDREERIVVGMYSIQYVRACYTTFLLGV